MKQLIIALVAAWSFSAPAAATDFNQALLELQHAWARVNYQMADKGEQEKAFEALTTRAESLRQAHPQRPEALIWEGIILSSYAGAKGGLGALGLVKKARDDYQAALAIDESALQGSAHTSLGVLYYKVPGWPLGFGSEEKAESHLKRALAINPDGIDPNYFYAEFLMEEKEDYRNARAYLEKALAAPDRPSRAVADSGRRAEIRQLLDRAEQH